MTFDELLTFVKDRRQGRDTISEYNDPPISRAFVINFKRPERSGDTFNSKQFITVVTLLFTERLDGDINIMVENIIPFCGTGFGHAFEALDRCHKLLRDIDENTPIEVPFYD